MDRGDTVATSGEITVPMTYRASQTWILWDGG
jgi:hypothetical protein